MNATMRQLRAPFSSQRCNTGAAVHVRARSSCQLQAVHSSAHQQPPAAAEACCSSTPAAVTCLGGPSSSAHSTRRGQRTVSCSAGRLPRVMFWGQSDPELTVVKLQVGMFGDVEVYQRQLDRIAGVLDGDDEEAMGDLVHDVVVMLSRNMEYCAYASTGLFGTDDFDELEQQYNKACLKERTKFKQETFSNVGGRLTTASLRETGADVGLDKWLCVTLIMAAEATVKLPKIRSIQDLKESLNMLGSLSPDLIVAVELLWTPQERGDSYSKDELLVDYPQLVTL